MPNKTSQKGDIRLALELIDFIYPLYKTADARSKAILVRDTFQLDITVEEIISIPSFKSLHSKKIISDVKMVANGKPQIITKKTHR